jgi:hypothetical protein
MMAAYGIHETLTTLHFLLHDVKSDANFELRLQIFQTVKKQENNEVGTSIFVNVYSFRNVFAYK